MLHILWMIVKVILIVLGILLGLALLAVLLVLFCPVRYNALVSSEDQDWKKADLRAGVSWLFHGISLKVRRTGGEMKISVRLLGIPLDRLIFRKKKQKEDREEASDTEDEIKMLPESEETEDFSDASKEWEEQEDFGWEQEPEEKPGLGGVFNRISGKLKEIPRKLQNIALTFKGIRGKIEWYKKLLHHPRTQEALSLVMKHAKFLIKHVLPTKVEGNVLFGFADPAVTGTVSGILGMSMPFHKNFGIQITPSFDGENILKGNVKLKGRVYGIVILRAAILIYFNKNVKYVIKRWKHKEG